MGARGTHSDGEQIEGRDVRSHTPSLRPRLNTRSVFGAPPRPKELPYEFLSPGARRSDRNSYGSGWRFGYSTSLPVLSTSRMSSAISSGTAAIGSRVTPVVGDQT